MNCQGPSSSHAAVVSAIKAAFAESTKVMKRQVFDRDSLLELREHLARIDNADIPTWLGIVLLDCLYHPTSERGELNPFYHVLLFLVPPWTHDDKEWNLANPSDEMSNRRWLLRYSTLSPTQARAIVAWLEFFKTLKSCQHEVDLICEAIEFWNTR